MRTDDLSSSEYSSTGTSSPVISSPSAESAEDSAESSAAATPTRGPGLSEISGVSDPSSSAVHSSAAQTSKTSAAPTATPGPSARQYYDSRVGIWYTVWWQDNKDTNPFRSMYSHWEDWSRMKPVRGYYSSGDPAIIREHMGLFNRYGIDYVILDDTNGHFNDGGSIASNINSIFATVRDMGEDNAPQIAVALGGAFGDPNAADPYGSMQKEADYIYTRYASDYDDIYFSWKNKPLLITYGVVKYMTWEDPRYSVRRATGNVNEWRVSGTPLPETGIWGWVFNHEVDNPEVYGVIPGFNKGVIQGDTASTWMDQILRRQGEQYMDMWLAAIKANRDTIVITSWNDFAEEPAIEAMDPRPDNEVMEDAQRVGYPFNIRHIRDLSNGTDRHNIWLDYYGTHCPYWYEEITWAYASLKTTLLDGYYYREESDPDVYRYKNGELEKQSAMPHGHPVIRIPDGYFSWFFEG